MHERCLIRAVGTTIFVILLATVSAPEALADEPSEAYSQYITKGVGHFKKGEYAEALKEFMQAYMEQQDTNLVYNIARCHEELGDWDQAIFFFQKYIEFAESKEGKADAVAKIADLSKKAAMATLMVKASVDGATIKIDDALVGTSPMADKYYVTPGSHKVTVLKDGFKKYEELVTVKEKEHKDVWVTILPTPTGPTPGPTPKKKATWSTWLTGMTISLGLGATFLGGGIAFHFIADSERQDIRDAWAQTDGPVTGVGQQEAVDIEDGAKSKDTFSYVMYGLAGAAAGAATVMLALHLLSDDEGTASVMTPTLTPTPGGMTFGVVGSF